MYFLLYVVLGIFLLQGTSEQVVAADLDEAQSVVHNHYPSLPPMKSVYNWYRSSHQKHPLMIQGLVRSYADSVHRLYSITFDPSDQRKNTIVSKMNAVEEQVNVLVQRENKILRQKDECQNRIYHVIESIKTRFPGNVKIFPMITFLKTYFDARLDCVLFQLFHINDNFNAMRISNLDFMRNECVAALAKQEAAQALGNKIDDILGDYFKFGIETYRDFIDAYSNFMTAYNAYGVVYTEKLPWHIQLCFLMSSSGAKL
ncbi:MAG: hypothetical protein K2X98_02615 [Alphaproteobacteria bacterium]|nr:hypothetical protein [Alphaproteobacteria bacterium]